VIILVAIWAKTSLLSVATIGLYNMHLVISLNMPDIAVELHKWPAFLCSLAQLIQIFKFQLFLNAFCQTDLIFLKQ
jgi:hypothetical protein